MQPTRLYNTLSKSLEPVTVRDPDAVTMYTCGPTVYDDSHIGNFRSFLNADLLRRWLESPLSTVSDDAGSARPGPRRVLHIMNITDVGHMTEDTSADGGGEDKMQVAAQRLEAAALEAKKSGTSHTAAGVDSSDPRAIAAFYAERFIDDARRLGMRVAGERDADRRVMPHASENIDAMKRTIDALARDGFAYRAGDAVYFDVRAYERSGVAQRYGVLSGNSIESLRGGAGGRVTDEHQATKRHPADFLLWKTDASHLMKWSGPIVGGEPMGEGYPGWHIECTAMSLDGFRSLLGEPTLNEIDLHTGGEDNIFPHHECEIAQSCAATGSPRFARHWMHTRHLVIEGEKMSKSKGNFYTARDLFAKGHEPGAVRLALIGTHYRANANFTMQGLRDAARTLDRWRRWCGEHDADQEDAFARAGGHEHPLLKAFADAMADDLNVSGAIGAVNGYLSDHAQPSPADLAAMGVIDDVLGVRSLERLARETTSIGVFLPGAEASPEVEALLAERAAARGAKDFARSDAIRDELAARGYAIKDVAGGKVEVGPA